MSVVKDRFRYPLAVFAGARLGLFALSWIGVGLIARGGADANAAAVFPQPLGHSAFAALFTALQRNDANWFLRIGEFGYRAHDSSAAFFPVYPLVIRAVSKSIGGHPLAAALVVSNAAFLAALVLFYDLTVREFSEPVARTSALLLALFPTAFFFFAPYSESLFLLFAVWAFSSARQERWGRAAIGGALAAATRVIGIVLLPALVAEALSQRKERGRFPAMPVLAACAVAIGPIAYAASWWMRSDDPLAPIHAQENWQRGFEPRLWLTLWHAIRLGTCCAGRPDHGYWTIDLALFVIVAAAAVWGVRRLRPAYSIYVWLSLLVPLLDPFPDRPLLSVPRFLIVLFPAFWMIADLLERRRLPRNAVIASFAGGLGVLALLFMNWYDIF